MRKVSGDAGFFATPAMPRFPRIHGHTVTVLSRCQPASDRYAQDTGSPDWRCLIHTVSAYHSLSGLHHHRVHQCPPFDLFSGCGLGFELSVLKGPTRRAGQQAFLLFLLWVVGRVVGQVGR